MKLPHYIPEFESMIHAKKRADLLSRHIKVTKEALAESLGVDAKDDKEMSKLNDFYARLQSYIQVIRLIQYDEFLDKLGECEENKPMKWVMGWVLTYHHVKILFHLKDLNHHAKNMNQWLHLPSVAKAFEKPVGEKETVDKA